jgi:hypothetical protein
VSLKKQARWKWIEANRADPSWGVEDDPLFFRSYNLRGFAWTHADLRTRGQGDRGPHSELSNVIIVEILGRALQLPKGSKVHHSGPVERDVLIDERHLAYSAARTCGCSMCSWRRPRKKALKKTKGRARGAPRDPRAHPGVPLTRPLAARVV